MATRQATPAPAISVTALISSVGKGKEYNDYELAAVMGWCRADNPANIPPIWFKYQITKSVATQQMMIMEAL